MTDTNLHTILVLDAWVAPDAAMSPFETEPQYFGLGIGVDGGAAVQMEECDGFTKVSSSHPDIEGFTLPGIFQPSLDADDVCVVADGAEICFKDIDPSESSQLPLITHDDDPFASMFPSSADDAVPLSTILGGEPTTAAPESLSQAYADYYFLKEAVEDVRSGRRSLMPEEDAYLRMHATAIFEKMKVGTVSPLSSQAFDFEYPTKIYWHEDPMGTGVPLLDGINYALTFDPQSGTEIVRHLYANIDESIPYKDLSEITLDQALEIELLHAKDKIVEELKKLDASSYYNHSDEIEAFAAIDDPVELADAMDAMLPKIERGQRLAELQEVAWEVGQFAIVGKRKINLLSEIRELALIEDEAEFAEGVAGLMEDIKTVSLANGLDALVEMSDELIAKADEILIGDPRDEDAYSDCSMADHGRAGCVLGVGFLSGSKNSAEYEAYFKDLKEKALSIRESLDSGNYGDASAAYVSLTSQDKLQDVISRLEGDLEMTGMFKFTAKIGIIITAAAIANVAVAAFGLVGATGWAGVGALALESGVFLVADKGLNSLLLREEFFEDGKEFFYDWAMTAAMFGFLRLGMKGYNGLFRQILVGRAGKAGAESTQKLVSELGLMGKGSYYAGLFAAEYTAFTAWDYLSQTIDLSREAGGLALPENFFTSESLWERFIFLACLKIGGALASPFTAPLQAKAMASTMKRFEKRIMKYDADRGALEKRLKDYEAKVDKDPSELDAILKDMTALLKQRRAIEKRMSQLNPDLVKSAAQTEGTLKNIESMQKEIPLLKALSSGSYGELGRARALKLLSAAKKQGLLTYRAKKSGDIVVDYKNGETVRLSKDKPAPSKGEAIWSEYEKNLRTNLANPAVVERAGKVNVKRIVDLLDSEGGLNPENAGMFAKAMKEAGLHFGKLKKSDIKDYVGEPKTKEQIVAEQWSMRQERLLIVLEQRRPEWRAEDVDAAVNLIEKEGLKEENFDRVLALLKPLGLKIPPANMMKPKALAPNQRGWKQLNVRLTSEERNRVQTIDPDVLKTSQESVRSLIGPQEQMAQYGRLRVLNVVEMPDGSLISYDNTRLAYAKLADLPSVEVIIRRYDEFVIGGINPGHIYEGELARINEYREAQGLEPIFEGSRASTWGEAMEWRLLCGDLPMEGFSAIPAVQDTSLKLFIRQ